jgi:hypothetical protein
MSLLFRRVALPHACHAGKIFQLLFSMTYKNGSPDQQPPRSSGEDKLSRK